jgi:hypothetical protein
MNFKSWLEYEYAYDDLRSSLPKDSSWEYPLVQDRMKAAGSFIRLPPENPVPLGAGMNGGQ